MVRMFVRHRVRDFAEWKLVFDDFDAMRRGMGVAAYAAFQCVEDPNDVTVWHDFASVEAARSFTQSEQLRVAMAAAGVEGEPTIWYTLSV